MPTPVWLTGFEYGLAAPVTAGTGLANTISGAPEIQGVTKKTGGYALKINPTSSSQIYLSKTIAGAATVVIKFDFLVHSWPAADSCILAMSGTPADAPRIFLDAGDHKLSFGCVDSDTGQKTSGAISLDTWYRIEAKAYVGATTYTLDGMVDGVSVTQFSKAGETASTITTINVGNWNTSTTCEYYYDNLIVSATGDDYPIGQSDIVGLRPNVDGTHNNAANIMEDSAGNDIHATNFPAYGYLDENPWTSTANADYVRQTANGTGNYAEILFADTAENNIHGAMALLEYASASTSGNTGGCIIIDEDATSRTLYGAPGALADYSESSAYYKSIVIPAPAGGWDTAAVNALKCRMGYSDDASPDVYWLAIMLEVAYGPAIVSAWVPKVIII